MARNQSESLSTSQTTVPTWPALATPTETTPRHDHREGLPPAARLVLRSLSNIEGSLRMHFPDGSMMDFGNAATDSAAEITVHRWRFFRRVLAAGDVGAGESYVDGDWSSNDLVALSRLFLANEKRIEASPIVGIFGRWRDLLLHRGRDNTRRQARRNISAHYDLSNSLYATFLDDSMTYSAGIFDSPEVSLAHAQRTKNLRMARLAGLVPGSHVLEIGCGWGSFAEIAATELGCRVTGITLSEEQARFARERMRRAGVDDVVEIRVIDYRDLSGTFDAIVSIEMLEAVGHRHLGDYFAACNRHLAAGGRAAIQTITIPDQIYDRYRRGTDWIRKHIFPGGHLPSLGAIQSAVARTTPFVISRAEDIGPHYATTLRRWRLRFEQQVDAVRALGFDGRFTRMWGFYLASCEAAFAHRRIGNLQLVLQRTGDSEI